MSFRHQTFPEVPARHSARRHRQRPSPPPAPPPRQCESELQLCVRTKTKHACITCAEQHREALAAVRCAKNKAVALCSGGVLCPEAGWCLCLLCLVKDARGQRGRAIVPIMRTSVASLTWTLSCCARLGAGRALLRHRKGRDTLEGLLGLIFRTNPHAAHRPCNATAM